ncbi:MAG: Hsp70 family protein [Deltaproteobacteria bacterium]|nr:Hsp70 family protein [Deltaproteobacteria bacterium]
MEPILGVDLGTTNSEVCAIVGGQPRVLGAPGERILPSFVGLSPEGKLLVGPEAKNQYVLYPERTVKSIKRKMGTGERVRLGDEEYTPQEISALILKKLKALAEAELGVAVGRAVITVPAYFSDAQRQATRDAGELAGLEVVRIINEPTAAALAYTAGSTARENVLVYDLGGGTFDVSVVRIEEGVVEVLASHGNNHLGGDDFDAKILAWLEERFQEERDFDPSADPRVRARLLRAAEAAKIRLSEAPFARVQEEYLAEVDGLPVHLDVELGRRDFEEMIRPYVDETLAAIHTALDGAGLLSGQIDRVLLVGGATRTPLIAETIRQTYGLDPHSEVDPDLCVALGAGVQAGMIGGERVGPVLVDVTPYTFGTSVLADLDGELYPFVYHPLIPRNTAIPVSRSEVFYTAADFQEVVEVNVYQGENRDAVENIRVGQFLVEGLSRAPAGNEIVLRFDLTIDGILKVTAVEKRTGKQKHITIESALSRFEAEEIGAAKERLAGLWEEEEGEPARPGEPAGPAAAGDAEERHETVRARAVMEKARGMMAEIPEDDVDTVVGLLERIEEALASGDRETARQATDELSDILFYLE